LVTDGRNGWNFWQLEFFCHRTQTASGNPALFYTNLGPFTRSKIVGSWTRPPSSAEIKNVWNYFSVISEVMWSVVMWSELMWFMWSDFILKWSELKWSEMSYGEVLGDKSVMYIRVTLYWGHLIILWLFNLGISCTVFGLTCTVISTFIPYNSLMIGYWPTNCTVICF